MSVTFCPAIRLLGESRGRPTVCAACLKVLAACQNCRTPYFAPPGSPPTSIEAWPDCNPAPRFEGAAAILLDPASGQSVSASIVDSVGFNLDTFIRAKGNSEVDVKRVRTKDVRTVIDLSGSARATVDGLDDDYTGPDSG